MVAPETYAKYFPGNTETNAEQSKQEFPRYLDPIVPFTFHNQDGLAVETSILIPAAPAVVYDKFVQYVWLENCERSKLTILERGNPDGSGSVRQVPYLNLIESVLRVSRPSESEPDLIGTFCYTLEPHFVTSYMGLVTFMPDDGAGRDENNIPQQTLVVWRSVFQPNTSASVLCCGGSILRFMVHQVFQVYLGLLKESLRTRR